MPLKKTNFTKLKNLIESQKVPIIIVHYGTNRGVSSINQEVMLEKACSKYPNIVQCVKIDIDESKKNIRAMKPHGLSTVPKEIPMVMSYVYGNLQTYRDNLLLDGEITDKLYGKRDNIGQLVDSLVSVAQKKAINH